MGLNETKQEGFFFTPFCPGTAPEQSSLWHPHLVKASTSRQVTNLAQVFEAPMVAVTIQLGKVHVGDQDDVSPTRSHGKGLLGVRQRHEGQKKIGAQRSKLTRDKNSARQRRILSEHEMVIFRSALTFKLGQRRQRTTTKRHKRSIAETAASNITKGKPVARVLR